MNSSELAKSHFEQLKVIAEHDGQWNWHIFCRYWTRHHDIATIDLKPLIENRLVEEIDVADELLPRLKLTEKGQQAIKSTS